MDAEFAAFVKRVGSRVAGAAVRRAVEEELLDHLVEAALEFEGRGMSSAEARRAAMQRFGDPDLIGRELAGVHNRIPFRIFAAGGVAWFAVSAVIDEFGAYFLFDHWLGQLPFQVVGLPHRLAFVSPQIDSMAEVLRPLAQFLGGAPRGCNQRRVPAAGGLWRLSAHPGRSVARSAPGVVVTGRCLQELTVVPPNAERARTWHGSGSHHILAAPR